MRISTSYQYDVYNADLQSTSQTLFNAQQKETTGLAINLPSDNPVGNQQVMNMQTVQNTLNQYQSNITAGQAVLTSTDAALQSAQTTMTSAQTIASQAASSATLDDSTRQGLITQVEQLQQSLLSTANSQGPNGEYLFAGEKTDTKPFSVSSTGALTYSGDQKSISVSAGPNETVAINVPGDPTFTNAYNALEGLKNDLQSNDPTKISNTDLASIASASTGLSQANGMIGANSDQLTNLNSFNTRRISDLTSNISSVKDVNIATAAVDYQSATNAYQAALEVVGKASSLSLMNYLSNSL